MEEEEGKALEAEREEEGTTWPLYLSTCDLLKPGGGLLSWYGQLK